MILVCFMIQRGFMLAVPGKRVYKSETCGMTFFCSPANGALDELLVPNGSPLSEKQNSEHSLRLERIKLPLYSVRRL